MRNEFGLSYRELSLVLTVFGISSALAQPIAGLLADRFGGRRVILVGLILLSLATLTLGLAQSFWMIFPVAILGGLGNSAFYPAGLSILSSRISRHRLGRAFANYALCSHLGRNAAITYFFGAFQISDWRHAILGISVVGFLLATTILVWSHFVKRPPEAPVATPALLINVAPNNTKPYHLLGIVACFLYLFFIGAAVEGIDFFLWSSLADLFDVGAAKARMAVTSLMTGMMLGICLGGVAADLTERHVWTSIIGTFSASLILLTIPMISGLSYSAVLGLLFAAGVALGLTIPARDMLIRITAPEKRFGWFFGIVYSGLILGTLTGTLALALILDLAGSIGLFIGGASLLVAGALSILPLSTRLSKRPFI
jgi:MFS transporter, FSR family, fosmidomycin resistance protein